MWLAVVEKATLVVVLLSRNVVVLFFFALGCCRFGGKKWSWPKSGLFFLILVSAHRSGAMEMVEWSGEKLTRERASVMI